MKKQGSISTAYGMLVGAAGFSLLIYLTRVSHLNFDQPLALAAFLALTMFTLSWGFPAPHIGHVSLDRLAQVAAILIFGAIPAAWINALAVLISSYCSRNTRDLSFARRAHGAGMFIFMILAAGWIYRWSGGPIPLKTIDLRSAIAIATLALTLQLLNEVLMAVMMYFSGLNVRRLFWIFRSLVELGAVPLGILTAIVYNRLELPIFVIFAAVLVLIIVILKHFAATRSALEHRVEDLLAINRVGQAINTSLILDDLVELIFQECRKLFEFSEFYLVFYDKEYGELDFRLHHNEAGRQPRRRKKLTEGLLGWIVKHNKPICVEDWSRADTELHRIRVVTNKASQSFIGVPVAFGNRVLGAISVQSNKRNAFDRDDLNLMATFASQAAVAIANARLYAELDEERSQLETRVTERTRALESQKANFQKLNDSLGQANQQKEKLLRKLRLKTEALEHQTQEDSLTGLYNRRYVDERLDIEFKRAHRFGHKLAVAMADVDYFKDINDNHSHQLGDEVLRTVAQLITQRCRETDVIARFGGEEFMLLFPETSLEQAGAACEEIRRRIQDYPWHTFAPDLKVTISIGVADDWFIEDCESLVALADRKLYTAKRSGRNRVCSEPMLAQSDVAWLGSESVSA